MQIQYKGIDSVVAAAAAAVTVALFL